ncbi:hypothetical protein C7999DRAFT_14030 [Corynascus novoguineensis]|uniref:Uncharacterized protein n=1 Tax=Corynascus novoguineensis TaxID=1126955 RepID=A0AAN7CVH3_9PEZI|nr:hypothetical protein C7999DRAFT_14030 [Corynascus novoguineensis]
MGETASSRSALLPLQFPSANFATTPQQLVVKEQLSDEFKDRALRSVEIWDAYASNYWILGNLGFRSTIFFVEARHRTSTPDAQLSAYPIQPGSHHFIYLAAFGRD